MSATICVVLDINGDALRELGCPQNWVKVSDAYVNCSMALRRPIQKAPLKKIEITEFDLGSGRITGVGIDITGIGERQLFRLDFGQHNPCHGNPACTGALPKVNELALWDDKPDLSYHVNKIY